MEYYDDWLVFLIVKKLDRLSLEKWNELIGDERDVAEWYRLEVFLTARFRILEGSNKVESKSVETRSVEQPSSSKAPKSSCHVSESSSKTNTVKCYYCKGGHRAKSCFTFKKKNPSERRKIVESANLCINCLSPSHKLAECASTHHSLLHLDSISKRESTANKPRTSPLKASEALESSSSSSSSMTNHLVERISDSNKDVLLATAIIVANFGSGKRVILKALLDQGSQMSLIPTFAARRLHLPTEPYTGVPLTSAGGDKIDTRRGGKF